MKTKRKDRSQLEATAQPSTLAAESIKDEDLVLVTGGYFYVPIPQTYRGGGQGNAGNAGNA